MVFILTYLIKPIQNINSFSLYNLLFSEDKFIIMLHRIKEIVGSIYEWYTQPEAHSTIGDIKNSLGASITFNVLIKLAIPELVHMAFVLSSGGICTIAFYFLNRYLKKNYP